MVDLLSSEDLANGKLDVKTIGVAANGDDQTDVTSRLGEVYPTLSKALRLIFGVGGLPATAFSTYSAMLASSLVNGDYAIVTSDTNNTLIGMYEKIAGSWVRSKYDYSQLIRNYGYLNLNSGADFPLKQETRNGVKSQPNTSLNNFLLDAQVINADPSKVYRVAYFQNGAVLNGVAANNWNIEEIPLSTLATSDAASTIIRYSDAGSQPQIIRNSGLQTVTLTSASRVGVKVVLTVDTGRLPTAGSAVNPSGSSASTGWSFIIDPVNYLTADYDIIRKNDLKPLNALTINSGKEYPFTSKSRDGVSSANIAFFTDVILDVKISNATPDHYYTIGYFKNGYDGLGVDNLDGWIIKKADIPTFNTRDGSYAVVYYTDTVENLTRDGKIQKVTLKAPSPNTEIIEIVLDTSKLATYGTPYNINDKTKAGWSWIIDPVCYSYAGAINAVTLNGRMQYIKNTANQISIVWEDKSCLRKLVIGKNGYNNLPNIIGVAHAPLAPLDSAVFTVVNFGTTDWLPPLVLKAVNNGDAHPKVYTGGNHGSDGGAGGKLTARNLAYEIYADGVLLDSTKNITGYASDLKLVMVNELCGYNTIGDAAVSAIPTRYIARQTFALDFKNGALSVDANVTALEDIILEGDNGVQVTSLNYADTMMYVGGSTKDFITFSQYTDSGTKTLYPNAWALLLRSQYGTQVSWMHRNYEAGDGRYVAASSPYIRGGNASTNPKVYHAVVAGIEAPIASGSSYKWRGGYTWADTVQTASLKALFTVNDDGNTKIATVYNNGDYSVSL